MAVLDADQGRLVEARAGFERALALAQQLGNPAAEQQEVHALALLDADQGRLVEARAGYERALALAQQLGDPAAEQDEVHDLAVLDLQTGRLVEARAGFERALALARQLGNPAAEAAELRNLGVFIGQRGELDRGRELIRQSLAICERLGDIYRIGYCHKFLAWLDKGDGKRDAAIMHYREALRCFEHVQSPDAEEVRAALRELEVDAEVERPFRPEVVRAVRAFLNTQSWEETCAVLEREQALLLSEAASQFLAALVERALQANKEDDAAYLAMHQKLLARAREVGIDAAWAEFESARRSDGGQATEE